MRRLGRSIRFRPEYVESILAGRKRATVRLGLVKPSARDVFLEAGGRIYGVLRIRGVKHVRVDELSDEDARADGFVNREELVAALRKIYPGIRGEDWVTVIYFDLARVFSLPGNGAPDVARVSRLALAYDVASTLEERRILALLSVTGSVEETWRRLGGRVSYLRIRQVMRRAYERLISLGVLR